MANTFKSPLQKAVVTWLAAHPGVSISELARRAEIDKGDLSKINSGQKASLNMESAARLAKAMGTTVEGLLGGETSPAAPAVTVEVQIDGKASEAGVRLIPLADIDPSPDNPRKTFDKEPLEELAASIAAQGLLQPLVVRPKGKRFEIVAGERRFRALTLNKAASALCVVREGDDDGNTRALRIIENLQRADIKPIEEADAFAALNEMDPQKWNAAAIGRAIGKSDRFVAQRISIARNLLPAMKEKLAAGELKVEVARVLASAPQKLQKVMANDPWGLRDASECRRKMQGKAIPLSKAAFKVAEYTGEFLEEDGKRWFADKALFTRLQTKAADAKVERLKKDYPGAQRVGVNDVSSYVWADDGGHISTWYYERKKEAKSRKRGLKAADCTALVYLQDNEIHVLKNVVLRQTWQERMEGARGEGDEEGETAGSSSTAAWQQPRDNPAYKEATEINARLTEALGQRPDLARRLALYAFFGGTSADIEINIDPRPHAGTEGAELVTLTGGEDGYFEPYLPPDAADDVLWTRLRTMEDAAVDAVLGRLFSETIHVSAHSKADGLTRAVAAELGIDLPERFIPDPIESRDEDEEEIEASDDVDDQAADDEAEAA